MTKKPVIVIGGGPVGMTAALLLAGFDISSVILETRAERDPFGSKALCMQRDVLDTLQRIGCGDPLVAEGVTWTMGRTYYRDHELFQITFPEVGESHFPPFVNIGQDRTEYWLERRIEAEPRIDLRYDHTVTAIDQDADGVKVTAAGPDGEVSIDGTYAIGADGARSSVRNLLGLSFDGRSFEDRFLICDISADLGFDNERRFFFDPEWNPDRQVLIHPQANSVWRIDWQVPPDFDIEAEVESGGLDERIRMIVGDQPYDIVWKSVYRFHQRLASDFSKGRVFLVGDAAHVMSPFGARGLNSGIQDAENLAWKIGFVESGWAPEGLLESYDAERRPAAEENLRITGDTMDFLVPPTPELWQKRRSALESAINNPDAATLVDSGRLAAPFIYHRSPLTTGASGGDPIGPGALCPDGPCVIEGRPTRLRQLIGTRVLVLTAGHDDDLSTAFERTKGVQLHPLDALDHTGIIRATLHLAEDATVVIRPDGHIAAIIDTDPHAVIAAVRTATGF